jgi:hypothetical protein
VAEVQLSNNPAGIEVNPLQKMNVLVKSVTDELWLNKLAGIEVNAVRPPKVLLNEVAAVLKSNNPAGIEVTLLDPVIIWKVLTNEVASVLWSNNPEGIADKPLQLKNVLAKVVTFIFCLNKVSGIEVIPVDSKVLAKVVTNAL